ncbi:cytochrome b5-like [Bidens hawaiensis]|uniref:cytochrome b5-like n=1 Tax=Bidens hawaiensis TaxID=980011 RepID=UPI0040490EEF
MKAFDFADVSCHNNTNDCWIVINARVYDITKFLTDHPGGDNVLLDVAGKDASEEFEDTGHGSAARLMLDEYYVGEAGLVTPFNGLSTTTNIKTQTRAKQQIIMEENMRTWLGFIMKSVGLLLPLAMLGGVIGFMLYK